MFGRPKFLPCSSPVLFESYDNTHPARFREVEKTNEFGHVFTDFEGFEQDLKTPQPPQSGIEARMYDISYCILHNQRLPEGSCGLNLLNSRNPYQDLTIVNSIVKNETKKIDNLKQKENETD